MNLLLQYAQGLLTSAPDRAQGPDLSRWDGGFDPTKATQRIDFAFMKLTEGITYVDSKVDEIWPGVKQVAVRGAYHYQRSGFSWLQQAKHFLNEAGKRDFHIFALDLEETNNIYDETFFSDTRRIIDYWRTQAPTKKVVLYINDSTYKQLYYSLKRIYPDGAAWLDKVDIWFAWPTKLFSSPIVPLMRTTGWTFWQWAWDGKGSEWGTLAATDINVFNGTREQLWAWAGITNQPAPQPEPDPEPDPGTRIEIVPEAQLFEAYVTAASRIYVRDYPLRQDDTVTGLFVFPSEKFSGYIWPGNDYVWLQISQSPREALIGKWVAVRKLDGSQAMIRLTKPVPPPSVPPNTARYRVRIYGDPVMVHEAGMDYSIIGTSNFQNVPVYNKANNSFGAVSNFLRIPHGDAMHLAALQVEDNYLEKKEDWRAQKMEWMCSYRGGMYMYDERSDIWQTAQSIRWGTLKIGRNVVLVDGEERLSVRVPSEMRPRLRRMMRLVGFRKPDWDKPLAELLSLGLVDRCYCVYKNNGFGDTPKGIIYSPFWSPLDWDFAGIPQPQAFYLPYEWLEAL